MRIKYRDIEAKSILSKSGIPGVEYCVNPYVGCIHACRYCYATFMQRFSGHVEEWGTFVDIKANAPEVLARQLRKTRRGSVMLSSVTDPYQPIEAKRGITRACLEVLLRDDFPVSILTKSTLVTRDIDLITQFSDIEVGLSITTDDDRMRRLFEPVAPPMEARLRALKKLRDQGVSTYAFVGPMLPMDPERLAGMLHGCVDSVMISRMNYVSKTAALYRRHGLGRWLEKEFVIDVKERLISMLGELGIAV